MNKENCDLIMFDDFTEEKLNKNYWFDFYLPQWSSRDKARPSYLIKDSILKLYISNNQKPWCTEWNDNVRVSNLQTGVFSGPLGSNIGQHKFANGVIVREEQKKEIKVAPKYGIVEFKARCSISKENIAALWLIGIETNPYESGEICLFELKGWNIEDKKSIIGYGVHPFGDTSLVDDFHEDEFNIDVSEWNIYAFDWQPDKIDFYINGVLVRTINQSPKYPMQLMLDLYDIENINNEDNTFEIDYVKVYQYK